MANRRWIPLQLQIFITSPWSRLIQLTSLIKLRIQTFWTFKPCLLSEVANLKTARSTPHKARKKSMSGRKSMRQWGLRNPQVRYKRKNYLMTRKSCATKSRLRKQGCAKPGKNKNWRMKCARCLESLNSTAGRQSKWHQSAINAPFHNFAR